MSAPFEAPAGMHRRTQPAFRQATTHRDPRNGTLHPAAVLVLALVALPAAGCREGHAWIVGVDELAPQELGNRLSRPDPPLVVDLRDPAAFRSGHIAGALSLPMQGIEGWFTRLGPARDRPIVTVCRGGWRSVEGAARIAALGYLEVYSLAGGMAAWQAADLAAVPGEPGHLPPALLRPPHARYDTFHQLVGFVSGFVVKPAYVLLALALAFLLRRQRGRDLALIRWSLVAFALGEGACYLNSFLALGLGLLWDGLHQLGMIVMGMLLPWGLWAFLDERVLRFSAPDATCTVQRLCGRCWKKDEVPCPGQRMLLFLVAALGVLAALPLTLALRPLCMIQTFYGTDWSYSMTVERLIVHFRVYPALALVLLAAALALALAGRRQLGRALVPFFAAFGFLSFALLRFLLYETYRDMHVWADFWEEVTELVAVVGVGAFLWVFRRPLGLSAPPGRTCAPTRSSPDPCPSNTPRTSPPA